jgi:hypothetical protein
LEHTMDMVSSGSLPTGEGLLSTWRSTNYANQ